jgi:hypothetical protein
VSAVWGNAWAIIGDDPVADCIALALLACAAWAIAAPFAARLRGRRAAAQIDEAIAMVRQPTVPTRLIRHGDGDEAWLGDGLDDALRRIRDEADMDDDWDDEPCRHDCDEECEDYQGFDVCRHSHCPDCDGCECPGYCDDHQTYNLRPFSETGGPADA